ncbi:leucyl aminopeptidase [Wohlfahrtiimonas chitiniclastica]|uniref:leucyl aminopeptidase n=1 Tax=Wohlfahrtiimonas chitiniclastica TaxID=400946 RepID=UPI001FF03E58|nr:leucyl aminopeptidase [Wohlfahrtiimonas chitiniclastica]
MKTQPVSYQLISEDIAALETDVLVVNCYEDELSPDAKALDAAMDGLLQSLLDSGEITGKAGSVFPIFQPKNIKARYLLVVGFGAREKASVVTLSKAVDAATQWVKKMPAETITFSILSNCGKKAYTIPKIIETVAHATYTFNQYKSKKDEQNAQVYAINVAALTEEIQAAFDYGLALKKGVLLTKDLGNTPANHLTPTDLSDIADNLAREYDDLHCKILNDSDIKRLGMGAIVAVSQGSAEAPNFIILEYHGAQSREEAPIVLVGKGVTFDSGGISLKPGAGMDEMKYDMCGAASVLGTMKAAAELALPLNIVALIPAVENMPSGTAIKPGDVVTSMSGQTIEILNTDAEGRLILCDALTYAEQYEPKAVIDVATLTGAIIIALGHEPTGLFANNQDLADALMASGEATRDRVWQLPMWDEYQSQLDSPFADIANIGGGRAGGSITAACFLSRFTEKYAWAHLDIAGTAWTSGANKGATGRPVGLLLDYLKKQSLA